MGSCLGDVDYVEKVQVILSSPKFTAVNCLKETYKGAEYNTTLWHLLLDNHKRWNYSGFIEIIQGLLSRQDLDFSSCGWSWAMKKTIPASDLCFSEWCHLAGGSRSRELWVDARTPRICLLSMCLHSSNGKSASNACAEQLNGQLDRQIDNGFQVRKNALLKKRLMQDLELLASEELLPLPHFLTAEGVLSIEACMRE